MGQVAFDPRPNSATGWNTMRYRAFANDHHSGRLQYVGMGLVAGLGIGFGVIALVLVLAQYILTIPNVNAVMQIGSGFFGLIGAFLDM